MDALNEGHKVKDRAISYCRESLCDVGLLAEEWAIDEYGVQSLLGFGVTERGKKIGIPTALSVLWYESKTNQSLFSVLGHTSSSGETRAPLNRARILDYMIRHPYEVREVDLATALGLTQGVVEDNLMSLNNHKIIDYKALNLQTGRTQVRYEKIKDKNLSDADSYPGFSLLYNQIIKMLEETDGPHSADDIFGGLPDKIKKNWREIGLRSKISRILSKISKQGFLKRVGGFRGHEKYSDACLTLKGKSLYFQVVYPVLLFSSGRNPSKNHLSYLQEISGSYVTFARNSAEFYYPHSASSKQRKSRKNRLQVVEMLQNSPDQSFTLQDLSEKVGLNADTIRLFFKPQTPESLEITLRLNRETSVTVQREKRKGVWYFRAKNPD